MKQAYNCPLCSIKRLLWALKTFFFSCHRHLLKNSEYNMVKSPEENACSEHFPPSEKPCRRKWRRNARRTWVSPPDALLKGLLGERATGCWELELNGLGKSETQRQRDRQRERERRGGGGGDNSECVVAHSCPLEPTLLWVTRMHPH